MSITRSCPHGAGLRADLVRRFGRNRVAAALAHGEVLSPWRGVLVDAGRCAEPLTIVAAARLAIGSQAVVSGPTAAFLHGLTAVEPLPVHLTVPYETPRRSKPGIVVHNGPALVVDREYRHDLPVLTLDRVLVDLACTARPSDALAVLDEALAAVGASNREALRKRLRIRLDARADPRGTRIGGRLVDLATGRAESPAESWLLWSVVDLGFPVPEVNVPILGVDGREVRRVDLGWRKLRIAVEYLGHAAHEGRGEDDEKRRYELERRGWIVIEVDVDDLRSSTRLEKELDEAFRTRGVDLRGRAVGALRPRRHRERRAG